MYEHVKATHSLLVQFISKMPCSHPCTMTPKSHVMTKYINTYQVSPTHDVYEHVKTTPFHLVQILYIHLSFTSLYNDP